MGRIRVPKITIRCTQYKQNLFGLITNLNKVEAFLGFKSVVKVDDEGVVDIDEDVPFGLGVTHVRLARDDRGLVDGLHGKDLTGVLAVNLTYLVNLTVGPLPEEPEDLEVLDPGRLQFFSDVFFHCRFCFDVVVCEQRGVSVKTVAAILFFLIHRFRGREISFVDERGRRHVLLGGHGGRQPIGGHL